tara:strand:+ start:94 stop:513 length:420 start_codon:yes stop_codon:yes gene_type:complete
MTKQERTDQWEKKIEKIVFNYESLSKCCGAANDAGALNHDGKLFDAIWRTHDGLLKIIDEFDWISWYVFENDCGSKKMQAGHDGKLSKITTPRQLARLIVEDENRNANQTEPEPESKDPHRFCKSGGGNNIHCGCKYDN